LAINAVGDEVATMDILALEALRVFDPKVHDSLAALADILVGIREPFGGSITWPAADYSRARLEQVLARADNRDLTSTVLRELFPGAAYALGFKRPDRSAEDDSNARERRRVAARSVLDRYIYASLASDIASHADVDRALGALGSSLNFKQILDELDDARIADMLMCVRARLDEAPAIDVVGVAAEVLSQGERVPMVPSGVFDVDPVHRLMWFVDDLVATLPDIPARTRAVESLLRCLPTLSLRDLVISNSTVQSGYGRLKCVLSCTS
jgi:hypothetical protein